MWLDDPSCYSYIKTRELSIPPPPEMMWVWRKEPASDDLLEQRLKHEEKRKQTAEEYETEYVPHLVRHTMWVGEATPLVQDVEMGLPSYQAQLCTQIARSCK